MEIPRPSSVLLLLFGKVLYWNSDEIVWMMIAQKKNHSKVLLLVTIVGELEIQKYLLSYICVTSRSVGGWCCAPFSLRSFGTVLLCLFRDRSLILPHWYLPYFRFSCGHWLAMSTSTHMCRWQSTFGRADKDSIWKCVLILPAMTTRYIVSNLNEDM